MPSFSDDDDDSTAFELGAEDRFGYLLDCVLPTAVAPLWFCLDLPSFDYFIY